MLSVENATVRFGGLTALRNVTFSMAEREILGLVGPNGAGKTTLFNAISGLVRTNGAGRIRFGTTDIGRLGLYRRARLGIGRTFQIPQPLHGLAVRENLVVAQRFGAGKVDEREIDRILDVMELSAVAGRDAATGLALQELKRLEVAKALATRPKLLLLDEVLAGLELQAKKAFMRKFKELHALFDLSIIVIEHDIETISNLCPRVVVLDFGQVIAEGSPNEVFRNPEVVRSYMGTEDA